MTVKPVPDGYQSVVPYLIVRGAAAALAFYERAFEATELLRIDGQDGKLGHAEVRIGDTVVMLADEHPEFLAKSPEAYGGSPIQLVLYVEDCDATFARAVSAGATVVRPLRDQFYGDRSGTVQDPFGHQWTIATHKEDLSPEEIRERASDAAPG